jgi:hypothetical protein
MESKACSIFRTSEARLEGCASTTGQAFTALAGRVGVCCFNEQEIIFLSLRLRLPYLRHRRRLESGDVSSWLRRHRHAGGCRARRLSGCGLMIIDFECLVPDALPGGRLMMSGQRISLEFELVTMCSSAAQPSSRVCHLEAWAAFSRSVAIAVALFKVIWTAIEQDAISIAGIFASVCMAP